jgi:hypothetical protein
MVPMTTTPTLKAWTQKPHSNVIPRPNVASQRMMPVHVNDHATAVAASVVAAVRGPRRVSPAIAKESHRGDPAEQGALMMDIRWIGPCAVTRFPW